ncbi:TetR family transcriptional regulator [Glaciihabitans sp. dw_435]|uniref:TetR family transcriptional regulator n=1 Tax=Glaciihabitans sp. dw_435 TaxID=2720081 RepID=UPI001BD394C2|nr:TetR family transcriptional regulator [Glaciihabitans sp. dw_435]
MPTQPLSVRAVSRHAVREELARIAFDEFCATGFDQVTFADLAGATGVSRSTFLRYFANKEDVVLFVFDPIGDIVAEALKARGEEDNDWLALRQAFDPAIQFLLDDQKEVIAFLDLIQATPALGARFREKQFEWRPEVARELVRGNSDQKALIAALVRVAAAFECFSIALDTWREQKGTEDLAELLDAAFGALLVPGAN